MVSGKQEQSTSQPPLKLYSQTAWRFAIYTTLPCDCEAVCDFVTVCLCDSVTVWHSVIVTVWQCDCVTLCAFDCVTEWLCHCVTGWLCVLVTVWLRDCMTLCACVTVWLCVLVTVWLCDCVTLCYMLQSFWDLYVGRWPPCLREAIMTQSWSHVGGSGGGYILRYFLGRGNVFKKKTFFTF